MTTGCSRDILHNRPKYTGVFNGTFYHTVRDRNVSCPLPSKRPNVYQIATHWWITGFKLGEFSDPDELSMDIIHGLIRQKDGLCICQLL